MAVIALGLCIECFMFLFSCFSFKPYFASDIVLILKKDLFYVSVLSVNVDVTR